jgi:lipoate---protein ligase
MQRLSLTLDSPAANLALDEALLDWAETTDPRAECLRVWESPLPLVVVGRSSRVRLEVDQSACAEHGIPILRRSSGGAAVVAGPGCLMYAVVLSYQLRPQLRDIRRAHADILERLVDALLPHVPSVRRGGTSDLIVGLDAETGRKFSGNSLRAKRTHLLYHGTLLYEFDLSMISRCLRMPPRQPDYRESRAHADFVTNLPVGRPVLEQALENAWPTTGELADWPRRLVDKLVATRFSQDRWNLVFGREQDNAPAVEGVCDE